MWATLGSAGTGSDYSYCWGGLSSIDLATDGEDLYAIYSSPGAGGKFQVSKIHSGTLAILSTATAPTGMKASYSNAFIACGVLYGIEKFYEDTTISYAWEFGTSTEWDPGVFWDVFSYFSSAQYSSVYDTIYAYDGGRLLTLTPTWE